MKKIKCKKLKQMVACMLATILFMLPSLTYLPPDLLTWGFGLVFVSSGVAGHPYLQGTVEGESNQTWFLCMNNGASAHSNYDYSKVDMDVDYNNGTTAQKRLFWAYIGAFGSADGDDSMVKHINKVDPNEARDVAWSYGASNGGNDWVEYQATDGFLALDNIPAGCKSPSEILDLISNYDSASNAMYLGSLLAGPGEIDNEKLYNLCGLDSYETFKDYCQITAISSGLVVNMGDSTITWSYPNAAVGESPDVSIIKVSYDPTVFTAIEVTGTVEFYQCNVAGSQQLYRVNGKETERTCEFYLTTSYSSTTTNNNTGDTSGGGSGSGEATLSLITYEHEETFQSNYNVGLEKKDFETGYPLEDSIWQVLERFDDSQLSSNEENGGIVEDNMREDPTTWDDWLVFSDDLTTDENGALSYSDERYYDYYHGYCNGHPEPEPVEEPDEPAEGEEDTSDYDAAMAEYEAYLALLEEWEQAVADCEDKTANSGGTYHHWLCNSTSEPSVEEAFANSGCEEDRDLAYENFINLQYDYTFRETNPRDGYITHTEHPDDVPIEIITTASSQAGGTGSWTSKTNEAITVSGYVRNMVSSDDSISTASVMSVSAMSASSNSVMAVNSIEDTSSTYSSNSVEESSSLLLTQTYDLPWGQRLVNALCSFFGLPEKYASSEDFTIKLVAKDAEELITVMDENELLNDLTTSAQEIEQTLEASTEGVLETTEAQTTEAETTEAVETATESNAQIQVEESTQVEQTTTEETTVEESTQVEQTTTEETTVEESTQPEQTTTEETTVEETTQVEQTTTEETTAEETTAEETTAEETTEASTQVPEEISQTTPLVIGLSNHTVGLVGTSEEPTTEEPTTEEPTTEEPTTEEPTTEEPTTEEPTTEEPTTQVAITQLDSTQEETTQATTEEPTTQSTSNTLVVSETTLGKASDSDSETTEATTETSTEEETVEGVYTVSNVLTYSVEESSESGAVVNSISTYASSSSSVDISGEPDNQPEKEVGDTSHVAYTWVVYDHRTPGQVHINKRDFDLEAGASTEYDSYGQTQGDATLEGAVYGLFAADAIYGPDTRRDDAGTVLGGTGLIFDANDLVAVATTDKYGDASFLAITEIPHSTYDYTTGTISYSGKAYPTNLYDLEGARKESSQEETGRVYQDNKTTNGNEWIGRPLMLGNYYIKELARSEGYELSITGKDLAGSNLGTELASAYGQGAETISAPVGEAWVTEQMYHAVTFPEGNATYGNRENLLLFETASYHATDGYNVVVDGVPEGADIYLNDVTLDPVTVQVDVGGSYVDATEDPLYMTATSEGIMKRDVNGDRIEIPGATPTIAIPYESVALEASKLPMDATVTATDDAMFNTTFTDSTDNVNYVKYELETMMRTLGMTTPKDGSYSTIDDPVYDETHAEIVLSIENVSTNSTLIDAILEYYMNEQVFTYGGLQSITYDGTTINATVVIGLSSTYPLMYKTNDAGEVVTVYLQKLNTTYGRYVMKTYTDGEFEVGQKDGSSSYIIKVSPDFTVSDTGEPIDTAMYASDSDRYYSYELGETLYDYWIVQDDGSIVGHEPVTRKVYEPLYEDKIVEEENVSASQITQVDSPTSLSDPVGATYYYYDAESKQYTIHVGSSDSDLTGSQTADFTIALDDGSVTLTSEDIELIGSNNVWMYTEGTSVKQSEYIVRVSGGGIGAFTSPDFDTESTYIKNQRLIYNGYHETSEDGNTNETPTSVQERVITSQIKVTKEIDVASYENTDSYGEQIGDWFTTLFASFLGKDNVASKMDNFQFKTYLKSNLERLYRDEDGMVVWQDEKGNELSEVEQVEKNEAYPALAGSIYTKVLHETNPLYQDSRYAVLANDMLYSKQDGLIETDANTGYTHILETTTSVADDGTGTKEIIAYNYEKFFDAIEVANNDKWKEDAPSYTSWRPIANFINRSEASIENAKVSDMVRQFAINWYLVEEVEKLQDANLSQNPDGVDVSYVNEVYDLALCEAIIKAENYLIPFFAYDLDAVYAISWDGDADGGNDGDDTTLGANSLAGDYYYNQSQYLPYGTYVVVEQQPSDATLNEFKNTHYEIDKPKEVNLPSVYASYEDSQGEVEVLNPYYQYDKDMTPEQMQAKHQIRFVEEPLHVIEGRNAEGDFEVYKYGMETEVVGSADAVPFPDVEITTDNPQGISYHDNVATIHGSQTAYDGLYASMLVPFSITASTDPVVEETDAEPTETGESTYKGFTYAKLENRFFTTKLRIEKLDSVTHENILHDEAIFTIYAASRDDSEDGEGNVLFYETDTTITGTKEFLESMRATNIVANESGLGFFDWLTGLIYDSDDLYSGVVPAGTPICLEENKIVLGENTGNETIAFASFTTTLDEELANEDGAGTSYQYQTVGYLETPQPLGAGVYVICESKAPSGYTRSNPIAIEVYSDEVTYYKEGNQDSRVLAALYEVEAEHLTTNQNKPQDTIHMAQVYIENAPINLTVEKVKESSDTTADTTTDKTVTYEVSGRVEGTLTELSGNEELTLAYSDQGTYLGYGWKTGTLEQLVARKEAGETVEIMYANNVFAGYGYITRALETSDDGNQYVVGATMTLFDAISLSKTGDTQDYQYEGLVIERSNANDITRMYVEEGYAGEKTDFIPMTDDNGVAYEVTYEVGVDENQEAIMETGNVYSAVTVQRPDTDILYYPLNDLEIFTVNHNLYAFQSGIPYLEFVQGDFNKISYSSYDKILSVDEDTIIYHLDRDGNRDSIIDPYTGMAYVEELQADGSVKTLVWTVNLHTDAYGNVIATDKITTSRVATIGENEDGYEESVVLDVTNESSQTITDAPSYSHSESGYITGSWNSDGGEESHHETSVETTGLGNNLNEEVLVDDNTGSFDKELNPLYDAYGLPTYYQKSDETYDKGTDIYDRDDDFVRYQDSDNLDVYNGAAYSQKEDEVLHDGDTATQGQTQTTLYHRQGEGYILENTWVTSDKTPNDPFETTVTDGQADVLKRVPVGNYIMEELIVPDGYLKALPTAITIGETTVMHEARTVDKTVKVEVGKVDKNSYAQVPGATIAIYEAQMIYTTDYQTYPNGYYFAKKDENASPVTYFSTNSTVSNVEELTAQWTTTNMPIYLEGIPQGLYVLEELDVPSGFVKSEPLPVEITNSYEVQIFTLEEDYTKLEIAKLVGTQDNTKEFLNGAEFVLYQESEVVDTFVSNDASEYKAFMVAFETMYENYGTRVGTSFAWGEKMATYVSHTQIDRDTVMGIDSTTNYPTTATMLFETSDGIIVQIRIDGEKNYSYQFDYRTLPMINDYACTYITIDGHRRYDYLPVGNTYELVETKTPSGYIQAPDEVILIEDTTSVQYYEIENQRSELVISKVAEGSIKELEGATLGLFKDTLDGELITSWVSGTDGVYTELDFINGTIPNGYEQGDLKPHTIEALESGTYYVVELHAPDFYTKCEPYKIEYDQETTIEIQRVTNQKTTGTLIVEKMNEAGEGLSGVVFELWAEDAITGERIFTKMISDTSGSLKVEGLPIGETSAYVYKLKETVPPEGYAINTKIHTFSFPIDSQAPVEINCTVVDEQTEILIGKKNFGEDAFVEGAKLAIYDQDELIEDWVSTGEEHRIVGLIAGRTYQFVELEAPYGYAVMDPITFTLSTTGHGIQTISNQDTTILLDGEEVVETVTLQGRYVLKTKMQVVDQLQNEVATWIITEDSHTITPESGIVEGEVYTWIESVCYSDGSSEVIHTTIKAMEYNENNLYEISANQAVKTTLSMCWDDGVVIEEFSPSEFVMEHTIQNPISPENPKITLDILGTNQVVTTTIYYQNPEHKTSDITITAMVDENTMIIDEKAGTKDNQMITWHMEDVEPFEEGVVVFLSEITKKDAEKTWVTATIESENQEIITTKEVPIPQDNQITVFHEVLGSGKEQALDEQFEIHLFSASGVELKGSYAYEGSLDGIIKSGDVITLSQNQFVQINPSEYYPNATATVERLRDGTSITGTMAVFTTTVVDEQQRDYFQDGETYIVQEYTSFQDGSEMKTNQLQMTIHLLEGEIIVSGYDKETAILIEKLDATTKEPLSGALLQLENEVGEVLETWISSQQSRELQIELESGVAYTLVEIEPPAGYGYANHVPIVIPQNLGSSVVIQMEDQETEVEIRKETSTGILLDGATLQIISQKDEIVVAEFISSNETPYVITGELLAGETYILREIQAPRGYYLAEDVLFTVSLNGTLDTVTMVDMKIPSSPSSDNPDILRTPEVPEKPETPEIPEEVVVEATYKLGYIFAYYRPGNIITYDTGDRRSLLPWCLLGIGSMLGLMGVFWRKRKEEDE